jgi:Sucrase/ferredoxin-like
VPTIRCSDAARARQEPLHASALRYGRFLLLEVPGPWGRAALTECSLDAAIAADLAARAERAVTRIELIRRPGRRDDGPDAAARPLAWAIADTTPGAERIRWGSWRDPAELPELDLAAEVSAGGPQRVALVCTNAKRDQCCARRGRPVAAALADATSWDTWECSHLGGHRFAANVLLLPSGEMFGELDPDLAVTVLAAFDEGEILLSHHRGRCGQRAMVQAAMHAAALRLGEGRVGALRGVGSRNLPGAAAADIWEVDVAHSDVARRDDPRAEAVYRLTVAGTPTEPALLSCADAEPKPEFRYEAVGFTRLR